MNPDFDIHALLEDLERRIDPAAEDACEAAWRAFYAGQCPDPLFSAKRSRPIPPTREWPNPLVADTLAMDELDAMAAQQLAAVSRTLADGGGGALAVRANYGVAILPSLFGSEVVEMDRELNLLPTCRAVPGGEDALRALLDAPPPSLDSGLGERVFAMTRRFNDLFADYPNVRKYVRQYHPDLQGPLDVLELVWGSDMFLGLVDEPELAGRLLERITETYERFLSAWQELAPPAEGLNPHWGMWWPGSILLRDDSAMNLPPEMYRDFALPWNQRLLDRFGDGSLHACGRVDHWLPVAAELKGLKAFNMSQPSYNDMEQVYRNTVDRGIFLVGLNRAAAEEAVAAGRNLHRRVQASA